MTRINMLHKLEISFWDRAIPLMSESYFVRQWIREAYAIHLQPTRGVWIPATLMISASLGFGMGYMISVMMSAAH